MITLNISDKDITSGAIPISWCVDHETINEIVQEIGTKNPVLLVVTSSLDNYSSRKEERQIMHLSDLMAYVSFKSPGKNRISVFILKNCKNLKEGKSVYLSRWSRDFESNIFDSEGQDLTPYFKDCIIQSASFDVDVPMKAFAKSPSEWEKKWVLWLIRDKGVDQCDFRRKRLFAYGVQPFIFTVMMVIRTLFLALSAGLLLRSFTLKFWLSPLTYSMEDSMEVLSEEPIVFMNLKKYRPYAKSFTAFIRNMVVCVVEKSGLLLTPIIFIPIVLGLIYQPNLRMVLPVLLGFAIAIPVTIIVVAFIANRVMNLVEIEEKVADLSQDDLLQVVCDPTRVNKPPSISNLPRNKRTVKLRFQDLKSKVCRPFAG